MLSWIVSIAHFSPHFSKFSFIVFIQFSPELCSFSSIHKKSSNPKMWNLQMKCRIWIMKTGLEMESRIKQDCSSKVKIIRTLSSDSICVLCVVWPLKYWYIFHYAVNLLNFWRVFIELFTVIAIFEHNVLHEAFPEAFGST